MNSKHTARVALSAAVPVATIVAAGILFWGVPAGSADATAELPDPAAMALLGADRTPQEDIVSLWQRKVADDPASAAFRVQLASSQLTLAGDSGDLAGYEVAEKTAERAVALEPDRQDALLTLARARAGQHDFTGALELAEEVLARDPASVAALLAAGDAQLELGRYELAERYYTSAASVVGAIPELLTREARLASITETADDALEVARRALVAAGDADLRRQDAAFYWFQLATYEWRTGESMAALDHVRTALSIDPNDGGSRELLGTVLVGLGQYDAAIAVYEDLVDGGGAADLHGELADLYRHAGRLSEADAQIELGLAVARRDADRFPAERRHLVGFLADHAPDEAVRLAQLDLGERQDVYAHVWFAWSLHRSGRHVEAAEAIRPALLHDTEDAWLSYVAGSIAASVGDSDGARRHLEAALELQPEFDLVHARRARALLADV